MNFHRIQLLTVLVFTSFLINIGYSQCGHNYYWASWFNFTGSSATGTINTNSQTFNVTMTANYPFDFTNNIYNYGAFNGFSGNLPPNTRVPKTTWSVGSGGQTTMCFSETVSNPVLLIASLGRLDTIVTLTFSRSYVTIFDGGDMTYANDSTIIGQEGYAIIMFPGDFDCITIFSTTPEWYTNITWGLNTPLFEIDLNGNPLACDSTTITASGGSIYNWSGGLNPNSSSNTFVQSGVYFITVTDMVGCTVVSSVTIDIFQDQHSSIQESICEGESYLFNGQNLKVSGTYTANFQSIQGCDSTVNLNLVVYPISQTVIQHQMCEGDSYSFAGLQLNNSGNYRDSLTNIYGCDSIITLILTVTTSLESILQQNICEGESFQFGGIIITVEGEYKDTITSSGGCDSIVTLFLNVIEPQENMVEAVICEGESFEFDGVLLTESGEYSSIFQNIYGCDSIVNLILAVSQTYSFEQTFESCDSFYWPISGLDYFSSSVYTYRMQTINGCDSIFMLNLSIHPSFLFEETIESLDSFIWTINGVKYNQSGNYEVMLETTEGCDSIYRLNLIINIPKNIFVPDAFSPNADGINDKFTIYGNESLERVVSLDIYDRWGNSLASYRDFPPNDTNFGWDGHGRGMELNPGVYIYMALVRFKNGDIVSLNGEITKTK